MVLRRFTVLCSCSLYAAILLSSFELCFGNPAVKYLRSLNRVHKDSLLKILQNSHLLLSKKSIVQRRACLRAADVRVAQPAGSQRAICRAIVHLAPAAEVRMARSRERPKRQPTAALSRQKQQRRLLRRQKLPRPQKPQRLPKLNNQRSFYGQFAV